MTLCHFDVYIMIGSIQHEVYGATIMDMAGLPILMIWCKLFSNLMRRSHFQSASHHAIETIQSFSIYAAIKRKFMRKFV